MWMFPVAIACGNTFILKPSEKDPSCGLRLAELMLEAGAPPGVLNVVNGDKEAVDTLLTDPRIAAVSFVGSTPIAKYVFTTGSVHGKRVQALGGAKNHMVVMPDADIEVAADALMGAAYGSAGERCMAISVAVPVTDRTANELIEAMAPKVRKLKIGPSTDNASEMGPLVTREHRDKVKGYVDLGVKEGASLVVDGAASSRPSSQRLSRAGRSTRPGLRCDLQRIWGPHCRSCAEEFEEALALPSDHEYGNGVAIFTRNGDVARNFTHGQLRHGGHQRRFPRRCPSIHSVAGRTRYSGTRTSTDLRACASHGIKTVTARRGA
jgi:malonate-semialdehyde dehydrogenase (acetylating)/methylmalonate-semialdehyde dehydrogenase